MKESEFRELLKSVEQAREIHAGERKPSRVFRITPVQVKEIRRKLRLSQAEFSAMICVSLATLRNWEQGRTYPEGAAIALLRVAESKPEAVLAALHSRKAA